MRILAISRYFFPAENGKTVRRGQGADIRIYELYKHLAKLGHDVHLIVPILGATKRRSKDDDLHYSTERFDGIVVHRVPSIFPFFSLTRLPSLHRIIKSLELGKTRFDVILGEFHAFHSIGCEGILLKHLLGIPLVLDVHDVATEKTNPVAHAFYKMNETISYKFCDAIITCSEEAKEYVKHRCGEKPTKVIINGVDSSRRTRYSKDKKLVERYGFKENLVVGLIGSLTTQHKIDDFLRAAAIILRKKKNVKFLIVGGGSEESNLKSLTKELEVEDSVIFTGLMPYEEIPRYLSAMDICVALFPEGDEFRTNIPLKVGEYMAAGKPSVITGGAALRNLVKNSESGLVAKTEDSESIASMVLELAKNPRKAKIMGLNGLRFAEKELSWKGLAKQTEKFLEELLNNKG